MKVFDLPRGARKSTRMIYASEFHNVPILCAKNSKDYLIDMAKRNGINIPEPISILELNEYLLNNINAKDILVDEPLIVLKELLYDLLGITINDESNHYNSLFILRDILNGKGLNIIGCSFSSENNISRWFNSDGYIDKTWEEIEKELDK